MKYPINILLEHEANFLELIDQAKETFGDMLDDVDIADYYSEICLNIQSIYFLLNRFKDINDCWSRIEALLEGRDTY